jgi:hypothetical protein
LRGTRGLLPAIFMACLGAFACGCASKKSQEVTEAPWTGDSGLAPPSLQQPDAAPARDADVAPIPSTAATVPPPVDAAAAGAVPVKKELLGEMSDNTRGAANVVQRPCDLETCGIVLAIGNHQAAESLDQDDGGPGLYMPQGMYSAETAGQPAVVDSYGVQKIVEVWDISVQMRDGKVQVIQQLNQPLFHVGDPVLVDGNDILRWN